MPINSEAVWGTITGDIDNQIDLKNRLDVKQDKLITNFAVPQGRVTGDITGDGKITTADLTLLKNHIADPTTYLFDAIQTEVADINHDGVIDNRDVTTLNNYLNGSVSSLAFIDYYNQWTYYNDEKYFYYDVIIPEISASNSISVFINTEQSYKWNAIISDGRIRLTCAFPPIRNLSGWIEITSASGSSATVFALGDKQDVLSSGYNIKTINGNSIVGSGNLDTINYVPKSQDWLFNTNPTVSGSYNFDLTNCYFSYFDGTNVQSDQVLSKIVVTYTTPNNWSLRFGASPYFNVYKVSSGVGSWESEVSGSSTLWPIDADIQKTLKTITLSSDASGDLLTFLNSVSIVQPKNVTLKDGTNSLYPKTVTKNVIDLSSNLKTINGQSIIGSGNISVIASLDNFTLIYTDWTLQSGKYYQDVNISGVTATSSVSVILNDTSDKEWTAECQSGFIRVYCNKLPTANITGWAEITSAIGSSATVFRNYDTILADKQKKLTAGANITITSEGVISATGGGGGGAVNDVKLNGASLVSGGIATIPIMNNYNQFGVMTIKQNYGLNIGSAQAPYLQPATNAGITSRITYTNADFGAILPQNIDFAVKAAMTDGIGPVWSAAEQSAARTRLGISPTTLVDVRVDNITVVNSEGVANIKVGSKTNLGVVSASELYGIKIDSGDIQVLSANNTEINAKTNQYKPIVPANLDYAVKLGLIDNRIGFSDAEKALARSTLGIILDDIASKSYVDTQTSAVKSWAQGTFIGAADIPVQDVRAAGNSIVTNNIATIPQAGDTYNKSGLTYFTSANGFTVAPDGAAKILAATNDEISYKVNGTKPIVPSTIDYATKMALSDPKISWTSDERRYARDTLGIKVEDVKILTNSIVDVSGSAIIPEASQVQHGVVRINENLGISLTNGQLTVDAATPAHISARNVYHPIASNQLGLAVKEGLGHSDWGITWSTAEKTTARDTLGIPVEDVKVDGDSVVKNKVAQISFDNLATKVQLFQEQDRATAAERLAETHISNEVTRATTFETGLQNSINAHNFRITALESSLSDTATKTYVDEQDNLVRNYVDSEGQKIRNWADATFIKEHQEIPVKDVLVNNISVVDSEGNAKVDLTKHATKVDLNNAKTELSTLIYAEAARSMDAEAELDEKIDSEGNAIRDWANNTFIKEHQELPVKDVQVNDSSVVDSEGNAKVVIPTKLSGFINDCGFTKVIFDYDPITETLNIIDR